MPNGKNILTKNSYINRIALTVSYAGPVGPIYVVTYSANDAVVGKFAGNVVVVLLAEIANELLNGIPRGKNAILIY